MNNQILTVARPRSASQAVIQKAYEAARGYERSCTGCAQSTVAGLLDAFDIKSDDVFRASSGLADGIGLSGQGACGGLIGSSMVIGLLFGRTYKDHHNLLAPMKSYRLSKKIYKRFIEKYGSCRCYDIQTRLMGRTYNLMEPKDLKEAIQTGMIDHCSEVVGWAAQNTAEIILCEQNALSLADYPVKMIGKAAGAILRRWG
jgi:C_GCAxxG_C_C family probable redox protein